MNIIRRGISRIAVVVMVAVLLAGAAPAAPTSAATRAQIVEAQNIANKFGMQVGAADGVVGRKTARGFCMFRYISGLAPSRATLDTALLGKMRTYNAKFGSLQRVPSGAINGSRTYLVAHKTCQMMVYAQGGYYRAVTPISTARPGKSTPDGTWALGATQRGWSCSSLYPGSCDWQKTGRFLNLSDRTANPNDNTKYGNLYNKRRIVGAILVHGATFVPTYPDSAGCVRVPVGFSDWMYDHVDAGIPIRITGAY